LCDVRVIARIAETQYHCFAFRWRHHGDF